MVFLLSVYNGDGKDDTIKSVQELNPSDLINIKKASLLSELDFALLVDFYAPIMGLEPVGLYMAMAKAEAGRFKTHADFFACYHLSNGQMLRLLAPLEALGLIMSFVKKEGKERHVAYRLFAPKAPKPFLSDPLLTGVLRQSIGEKGVRALAKKYDIDAALEEGYQNETTRFGDYFNDSDSFDQCVTRPIKSGGRLSGKLALDFDRALFFQALQEDAPSLEESDFSERELVLIGRLATFYKYSEEAMASFAIGCFDKRKKADERLDIDALEKLCLDNNGLAYLKKERLAASNSPVHGSDSLAIMLRRMDKVPAYDFFVKLHHGNKPANSDVDIIRELRVDMGLPDSVVNALVFYVLEIKGDQTFARAFVTKLGGQLSRAGVTNALDALNLLQNGGRQYALKRQRQTPSGDKMSSHGEDVQKATPEAEQRLSEEEIDAFFDED